MLEFMDFSIIFLKLIIYTICIILFAIIIFFLINLNCNVAYFLCKMLDIPKDLALSAISPGFANEIVLVLVFFETIVVSYLGITLSKNKFLNDLYYKIRYL